MVGESAVERAFINPLMCLISQWGSSVGYNYFYKDTHEKDPQVMERAMWDDLHSAKLIRNPEGVLFQTTVLFEGPVFRFHIGLTDPMGPCSYMVYTWALK